MEISYKNEKLRKLCEDVKERRKVLGQQVSDRLGLAIQALEDAENLLQVSKYQFLRLHKLFGDRIGTFGIDLNKKSGFRLILRPLKGSGDHWESLDNLPLVYQETVLIEITEVTNHYE